jgi:pyruvate dehydrogenase E1 component alpha subunit
MQLQKRNARCEDPDPGEPAAGDANMPDHPVLRELYEKVFTIRKVEEAIQAIYPSDVMKTPVHLSLGEEAIVAGVCQALNGSDQVFGTYRNHALYVARGADLSAFFGELYGRRTGVAKGKAGSMHLSAPDNGFPVTSAIVASILPVALGAAYALKIKAPKSVAAVFFGDGATEEGVFWESLNIALLYRLPVVFVCEDNGLAIHASKSIRQAYDLDRAVGGFGMDVFTSDSTDPVVVYSLARRAVSLARNGHRPVFLHLHYHRYLEHVGINEDYCFGYRCKQEHGHWYEADPVDGMRKRLFSEGIREEEIGAIETVAAERIRQAVRLAACSEFPESCELLKDVLA